MNQISNDEKETFGRGLLRHWWMGALPAILLVALILDSCFFTGPNALKQALHAGQQALPPGLEPYAADEDTGEYVIGMELGESQAVGQEYFDHVVFLGDSITDGLNIYNIFGNVRAVTAVGISPSTAMTHRFYYPKSGVGPLTMPEAVEYYQPQIVYIMLGTNGLEWLAPENNVQGYAKLIDDIRTRVPGCDVVIQSIPPATRQTSQNRPSFSRANIESYNRLLLDLALAKGVYFLDVHAALCDENGYLIGSIAAGDGLHMTSAGYRMWYDYVINHAVKGRGSFGIGADGRIVYLEPAE